MKKDIMRIIHTSIVHLLGFFGVLLLVILGSLYTAIAYENGARLPLRLVANPETIRTIAQFKPFNPTCSLPKTTTEKPIVYSECEEKGCFLVITTQDGSQKRLPAISEDPISPTAGIDKLFYSQKNQIISYTTPSDGLTSRVVIDFDGRLIQSIDETPGIDRTLTFAYYNEDEDTLVYFDEKSKKTYHYKANGIGLWITDCLKQSPNIID